MYERFFGLVDAPFRLTPDPRYLFLSPKHAEALAHLRLGLTESSGFVCITGDVGTGKTTLLRAFMAGLGPEVSMAYIFNPALSALELLQTINSEFGLPGGSTSRKVLVDSLNAHLLFQRKAGRRAVVVIDEAQALSVDVLEELRLLSNLETTTEKLLRIVLVGQPQLRALLLHPALVQLNQRITLRWHMGPLARHETAGYVRHRLGVASRSQAGRLFTPSAIRLLHRLSGGVPRLINMIAHRSMLAAFAADRRVVGAGSVRRAYREIGAVPLPVGAPPPARRAAWAAIGIGVCLGVIALAAGRFTWLPGPLSAADPAPAASDQQASVQGAESAPVATPPQLAAVPPSEAAPAPQPAEPKPAEEVAAPPAEVAAPAADPPPPDAAPPATVQAAPAVATPPPTPENAPERRLAALAPEASVRAAVQALLAAWHAPPLAVGEGVAPSELQTVARKRGLGYLPLVGNGGMLRLLDLPAILELRIPETAGPRYATLTGVGGGGWLLSIEDGQVPVDAAFLERYWFGQAHLFWRDFEALGPTTLGIEASGAPVVRLQELLRRVGAYGGAESGKFDWPTASAVLQFQRSRLLLADARVGPLTSIVLYAAAGGYSRPTLAPGTSS